MISRMKIFSNIYTTIKKLGNPKLQGKIKGHKSMCP